MGDRKKGKKQAKTRLGTLYTIAGLKQINQNHPN
jgi:hypothetical protein